MQLHNCTTLVVGAGPAGLAIAGQLTRANLPYTLLEGSEHIGYSWRTHYDRLHLHTANRYSALPYFPFPTTQAEYVSRLDYVDYLERYAEHFAIQPQYNQVVTSIRRNPSAANDSDRWQVQTRTDTFTAGQIVVATGYNRLPYRPQFSGQSDFRGLIWHSSEYRNGSPFRGKNVLVVGMGNTGAELALDLLEHDATPFVSVRSPVNIVHRELFGRSTQHSAVLLNRLPAWLYDRISHLTQHLTVGDLSAYGLGKPEHGPTKAIRNGKTPVIDVGTLEQIKAGRITVLPGIERIRSRTITFTDGRELPFDAVILATGFRSGLETLLDPSLRADVLDNRGLPTHPWFDRPGLHGLYFLGYSIPLTGALRHISLDSERIVRHLRQTNLHSRTH